MSEFEADDAVVAGTEAGMSMDPSDRGNWTGGVVGAGELRGTKYGIAASAHPGVDIANLTLAGAQAIRKAEYFDKIQGDRLPPGVSLIVYDSAINNGVGRAIHFLQEALGVTADGAIGDRTMAAIEAARPFDLMAEFLARRTDFMARDPQWSVDGLGWSRRLARLPFQAIAMLAPAAPPPAA